MKKPGPLVTDFPLGEPGTDELGYRPRAFATEHGVRDWSARMWGELTPVLNVVCTHGGEAMKTELSDDSSSIEVRVLRAVEGGERRGALALCVEEYGRVIGRLCMAMLRSQAEAEDVVQETFVAAYQGFEAYRGEAPLRSWLCGIARKKCLKFIETRRRRDAKLVLLVGGEPSPNAEEILQRRQRADRARQALQEIRPSEREALLLRYQCELDYDGVASACSIDEAAARKRVSRGLTRLREVLAESEAEAS
jgi:RNA polymerase sigma-70 factor, ECF subfamily